MVIVCKGCQKEFASKNELFRHLNKTAKTCLPLDEYNAFIAHIRATKREKVSVIVFYILQVLYYHVVGTHHNMLILQYVHFKRLRYFMDIFLEQIINP